MAASSSNGALIFVYGTLMYESVLRTLLGKVPPARAAALDGWCRLKIQGKSYPALVQGGLVSCQSVRGLLLEVTSAEITILDEYEGSEYVKAQVRPRLILSKLRTGEMIGPLEWATSSDSIVDVIDISGITDLEATTYTWVNREMLKNPPEDWEPDVDFAPNESEFVRSIGGT
jgi:gamma-glutamylcyclotransferase (GGCT)/AIG2-like uncharacterized protein YtfP